jgi:hypothetical protein
MLTIIADEKENNKLLKQFISRFSNITEVYIWLPMHDVYVQIIKYEFARK